METVLSDASRSGLSVRVSSTFFSFRDNPGANAVAVPIFVYIWIWIYMYVCVYMNLTILSLHCFFVWIFIELQTARLYNTTKQRRRQFGRNRVLIRVSFHWMTFLPLKLQLFLWVRREKGKKIIYEIKETVKETEEKDIYFVPFAYEF